MFMSVYDPKPYGEVDTNAAHWRFCTVTWRRWIALTACGWQLLARYLVLCQAIIYLSSLGPGLRGGETVFPVALDPCREGMAGLKRHNFQVLRKSAHRLGGHLCKTKK